MLLPPHPITFKGSRLAAALLRVLGWQVDFAGLPQPRGVIAVYPHTSNWDFVIGILAKWAIGIPVRFWGKQSLFEYPIFGAWLRSLGGIPVDRTSAKGAVNAVMQEMQANDFFWLAMAPEGTRKRVGGWRSGFYRVAVTVQVPIGVCYLDYTSKHVGVTQFFVPTGVEADDFALLKSLYQGRGGYHADQASPIQLLEPSIPRSQTIVK